MPKKKTRNVCITFFLLITLVFFTACGMRGTHFATDAPTIKITSYTGFETDEEAQKRVDDGFEVPYQQEIFWSAESTHGVIKGYAYRISNVDGIPISTPGNDFIDEGEGVTPLELVGLHGDGWVLHYVKGSLDTTPLNDPNARRTVWTDKVKAIVNFPAHNGSGENGVYGDSTYVPSKFEVVAIDNFGKISNIATRYFFTTSSKPDFYISTSKGAFEDRESSPVGLGIRLQFTFVPARVSVVSTGEWYYMYRLYKISLADSSVIDYPSIDDVPWYTTKNEVKVSDKVLTRNTINGPDLSSNYNSSGVAVSKTILESKVVDLAGVVSNIKTTRFYVTDKYKPQTLVYPAHTYVISDYHYIQSETDMEKNSDIVPSITSPTGTRFSTPFVATPIMSDHETITGMQWTAVGNNQTRIWFRWGYRGEFEDNNNPNKKSDKRVLDRLTGEDYKSEISHFYIQLNGSRYNFPALLNNPNVIQDDPLWLKVPVNHEIAQKLSLVMSPGNHTLRIAALDLQGERDPYPATFNFEIVAPKPISGRQGVLYISNNMIGINVNEIKNFYQNVLPPGMPATFIERSDLLTNWFNTFDNDINTFQNRNIRDGKYLLAYSLLQQYKYVIYAWDSYDSSAEDNSLEFDVHALTMYMQQGGNVIIVGNTRLSGINEKFKMSNKNLLVDYFGFGGVAVPLTTSLNAQTREFYFKGANATAGMTPSYLKAEVADMKDTTIRNLINVGTGTFGPPMGLPSVTYFMSPSGTPIYLFDCKMPNDVVGNDRYKPTEANYQLLQNKIVAFKKTASPSTGTGYVFGVPLLHLEENSVRQLFQNILQ